MTDHPTSEKTIRPFPAAPDPHRYFPSETTEESRQRIIRCISRGEGPSLVIGAAGMGKSLLLEVLAAQCRDYLSVVTMIGAQLCTRKALLQMILFELDLPYRGMDEGELRLSLVEFLRPIDHPAQCMLLLVDEADSLPTRLLEELRVLTNITDQGQPLVNLVLAGNTTLEERFAEAELEAFSQRVSTRCYLAPFGREETFQYVRSQVSVGGYNADQLFSQDGLEAMFFATDGIPRLVNQLGDQLVWMAEQTSGQCLDGTHVQAAWSELQQLPAPWNHSSGQPGLADEVPGTAEVGEMVEFGGLDESADDESPASIPFEANRARRDYRSDRTASSHPPDEVVQDLEGTDLAAPLAKVDDAVVPVEQPQVTARDPFAESYETEEVVFDPYLRLESPMLVTAPQVVNMKDQQLAEELERYKIDPLLDLNPPNPDQPSVSLSPKQDQSPPRKCAVEGHVHERATDTFGKVQNEWSMPGSLETSVLVIHPDLEVQPYASERGGSTQPGTDGCQGIAQVARVIKGDDFRYLFNQLGMDDHLPKIG
jgi:type II secretory pathway predicted ATPase ExeA